MKIRKKVQVNLKESLEDLIYNIKSLPGNKVLTLAYYGGTFEVELEEFGKLSLPQSFLVRMDAALRDGGGMIIRQILPTEVEITSPTGLKRIVQETKVYGIAMGKKIWKLMSKEEIREAKCRDPKTGQLSSPGPGVFFGEIQKVKPD
jgi:hypothetical protein